jgi:NAD(P) transhydrogenase subunit alpha
MVDAAEEYGKAVPMMMTAAGTVPAARVFVMGAGVAGLQAIATARRMGGIVTATDVRPAAKEQVESLGAKFIAVEDEEFKQAETAGGYSMKPGSVIVDLAVERGGNCEGAKPGEVADHSGVKIVGHLNVPGRLPASASSLYARNLYAFVETLVDKATKQLAVKWDDELVKATCLTRDGAIVHTAFQPKT